MTGNISHGHNSPGHQPTGHPWDGLENPRTGEPGPWGYDYHDGFDHMAITPEEKQVLDDRGHANFTGQF